MSYGNGNNAPLGLLPSQYLNGTTWNGQFNSYPLASGYATSLFYGDPVNLTTTGKIQIAPVGTTAVLGVFVGIQYIDANGNFQTGRSWTANTVTQGGLDAVAFVVDDPNVLYDIQVSTSANQPGPANAPALVQANMGQNAEFNIATAANSFNPVNGVTPAANPQTGSATGNSAYFLDFNSLGAGATLPLKLVRFTPVVGNGPGIVFNNALVLINNDIYRGGGTGTAGTH